MVQPDGVAETRAWFKLAREEAPEAFIVSLHSHAVNPSVEDGVRAARDQTNAKKFR